MQTLIDANPSLQLAVDREKEFFEDPDLRRAYQQEELRRWNMLKTLESRYDEGMLLGRNEGITIGRNEGIILGEARGEARGIAKGIAQGKAEGEVSMVLKMLNAGMDVYAISSISGFTPEQIGALQQNM